MLKQPLNYLHITQDYSDKHKAVDLAHSSKYGGTYPPVFAMGDGVVEKVYQTETGGNCLQINYGEYSSIYKHLKKIYVKEKETVKQGDKVAQMGSTGTASTGSHLHLELYKNGKVVVPYEHFVCDADVVIANKPIDTGKFKRTFQIGDKVKIINTGNSQASGKGKTAKGIGYKRQIKAIYDGKPYPYKVGNKLGTTGYYQYEALEKI